MNFFPASLRRASFMVLLDLASYDIFKYMSRREYKINITVNEILIERVIIDPHYQEKHAESINDKIILELVKTLDGKIFEADDEKFPFSYFVTDRIEYEGKLYKLIWLLEDHEIYIGVINAYRR